MCVCVCVCVCWVAQLCLTLCDPMDCSPPGSSVHGIVQAKILEWVAIPSSRGSSQPRNQTQVSCIAGEFFTIWATRGALLKPWNTKFVVLVTTNHKMVLPAEDSPGVMCMNIKAEKYRTQVRAGGPSGGQASTGRQRDKQHRALLIPLSYEAPVLLDQGPATRPHSIVITSFKSLSPKTAPFCGPRG